jgi:mannose-1-phosphate guanylyltransferase
MNILIFAGGSGTRLWPASRKSTPKQFLNFVGDSTLLQQTYKRMRKGFRPDQIYIATTSSYAKQIAAQLPKIKRSHFSLEPARRDRGPALGLAALIMKHESDDDIFATAWSDDHIKQEESYHKTLRIAESFLKRKPDSIIAVGITPSSPSTGFRYIQSGKNIDDSVLEVRKFTDKPSQKLAKQYFESGKYLINSGYFISSAGHILELYKKYRPECYRLLKKIEPDIGTKRQTATIEKFYPKMPSFDFEEILINNPEELLVTPGSFDWADVGRWSVIKDIQSGLKENLTHGLTVSHETTGSLIYNYNSKKQIVTTLHVNNLVIVVTPEAILVADKNSSEELKKIIEKLKLDKDLNKFL